ncbi:hypothetical protein PR003_g2467 [Phytophthora rubi]|uniref:Secreted protein n=1 Tax=Phytophthora rubi TaxID=129364 RepID=A0A6A3NHW3_9STRA|nr:hypothetical protein PR002_g2470 [Phytophthora rubi]KAE9050365.1 hypothetical protein PR001_g2448 [Phytophthora rubi]KAE9356187.1 hypothetical protein PR003_g2467 [Phytophthora rubi]
MRGRCHANLALPQLALLNAVFLEIAQKNGGVDLWHGCRDNLPGVARVTRIHCEVWVRGAGAAGYSGCKRLHSEWMKEGPGRCVVVIGLKSTT